MGVRRELPVPQEIRRKAGDEDQIYRALTDDLKRRHIAVPRVPDFGRHLVSLQSADGCLKGGR